MWVQNDGLVHICSGRLRFYWWSWVDWRRIADRYSISRAHWPIMYRTASMALMCNLWPTMMSVMNFRQTMIYITLGQQSRVPYLYGSAHTPIKQKRLSAYSFHLIPFSSLYQIVWLPSVLWVNTSTIKLERARDRVHNSRRGHSPIAVLHFQINQSNICFAQEQYTIYKWNNILCDSVTLTFDLLT